MQTCEENMQILCKGNIIKTKLCSMYRLRYEQTGKQVYGYYYNIVLVKD